MTSQKAFLTQPISFCDNRISSCLIRYCSLFMLSVVISPFTGVNGRVTKLFSNGGIIGTSTEENKELMDNSKNFRMKKGKRKASFFKIEKPCYIPFNSPYTSQCDDNLAMKKYCLYVWSFGIEYLEDGGEGKHRQEGDLPEGGRGEGRL